MVREANKNAKVSRKPPHNAEQKQTGKRASDEAVVELAQRTGACKRCLHENMAREADEKRQNEQEAEQKRQKEQAETHANDGATTMFAPKNESLRAEMARADCQKEREVECGIGRTHKEVADPWS
mmetsp:Transcript_13182/g.25859  ORF Transcript_13182/g.25859 Transcript_13182/m.25859 type:complete len:125 (-) Transcript_13182:1584-1958(-)